MLLITALFLLTSIIGTAQSQNWVGTYIVDAACGPACCCVSGKVVFERPATNALSITSGLSGNCGGQTQISATVPYPPAYTVDVPLGSQTIRCILSVDGQVITATNLQFAECSGHAYRSGVIKRDANVMIPFALMIAAFFLNYSKE